MSTWPQLDAAYRALESAGWQRREADNVHIEWRNPETGQWSVFVVAWREYARQARAMRRRALAAQRAGRGGAREVGM